MWNFKKFTSGFAAMAVAATAFVAVPLSAGAAVDTTGYNLIYSLDFDGDNLGTENASKYTDSTGYSFTMYNGGNVSYVNDTINGSTSKALKIDSRTSNDYIELPDGLFVGQSSIIVSFDVKPQTSDNGYNWAYFTTPQTTSQVPDYEKYLGAAFDPYDNSFHAERYNNNGSRLSNSSKSGTNNSWQHVDVVYSKDELKLFVDGTQDTTNSTVNVDIASLFTFNAKTWIGHANWGAGEGFQGMIDNFKIYGDHSVLCDYGTGSFPWTSDNLAEWTLGGNPTLADGIVTISGKNGSYSTSKTISHNANSIINVEAVWRGVSNNGREFSAGNGSYFRFGNIIVAQNDQNQKHGYGFNGLENIANVTQFTAGNYRQYTEGQQPVLDNYIWLKINMEINTATNTLTSFSIKSEDGATEYVSETNITLSNPDYNIVGFGYKKGSSVTTTNIEQLKCIRITEMQQSIETANYTIKHIGPNSAIVKADVTRTGVVGNPVTLTDNDKSDIVGEYYYVNDDSEGKTVNSDGSTIVTVYYRAAVPYTCSVLAKCNNTEIRRFSKTGDDTEKVPSIDVYYKKYIYFDGKYYVTDDSTFKKSFEAGNGDGQTVDVTYQEANDVLFAADETELTKSGSFAASASSDSYSEGSAQRLSKNSYVSIGDIATEDTNCELTVHAGFNRANANVDIYFSDGTNHQKSPVQFEGWSSITAKTVKLTVPTGKRIILYNNDNVNNSNLYIDYVVLKKLPSSYAKYVQQDSSTSIPDGMVASDSFGGARNGSTIATALVINTITKNAANWFGWNISVPASSPNNNMYSYIRATTEEASKYPEKLDTNDKALPDAGNNYSIYKVTDGFTIPIAHTMPTIAENTELAFGIIINNLYAPNATFTTSYLTTEPTTADYNKVSWIGDFAGGDSKEGTVVPYTGNTLETTAFGELMSIDNILTMMYDDEELAEITGDIASEDNADVTGIDDDIDMTDYNDNGEAVGE